MSVHSVSDGGGEGNRSTPRGELQFPEGFVWGTATASYQIEGATDADGRKPSIWDTFSHTLGKVIGGDNGDIADDHYHQYASDVALVKQLGCSSYRFSLAWPRLQPDGVGRLNPRGLDFYRRLLDELEGRDIQPWVTLYHWDLPQALEDKGGWPQRDTASRFAEYSRLVFRELSDRVQIWTTLNEPWCSAFRGYAEGKHAPGRTEPGAAVRAAHHLLLGHGQAVRAMRAEDDSKSFGITLNLFPVRAATPTPADDDARRRIDGLANRIFLDPLLRGSYPDDVVADLGAISDFSHVLPGDEAVINAPLDVLGVNYYMRHVVSADEESQRVTDSPSPWVASHDIRFVGSGRPRTKMGWEIDPDGMYDVLVRLRDEYPAVPLYITENGAAVEESISADGAVRDPERIEFLDAHFRAAHRAISDGVDLRGFFVWSLLDNFEWAWGYDKRFGLIRVDYETLARTPKLSSRYFSDVASHNRLPADLSQADMPIP